MITLIKNIQLIDGAGRGIIRTDVLVREKFIAGIGNLSGFKADEVIDGIGTCFLSPGFIDIHTSLDHYLGIFREEHQKNLLLAGVTTVIGGQDGVSLAPLIYGSLESLLGWIDTRGANVNWHTVREFLQVLNKKSLRLNFGTFVGYTTIVESLTGKTPGAPHPNERRVIRQVIEKALEEGAFGVSFGNLGRAISYEEIKEIVAKFSALYSVNLSFGAGGQAPAIGKILYQAEESGVKTLIGHLEPVKKLESEYEKVLEEITLHSSKADVFFEIYPAGKSIMKVSALANLSKERGSEIRILSAPGHEYLNGKSLAGFSRSRGLTLSQAMPALVDVTGGRGIVSYQNLNPKVLLKSAGHDRAIFASADGHASITPFPGFLQFLTEIEKDKILPIETALSKFTGLAAQRLNLRKRGIIKVGNFADLVVFRGTEIREVFVNGRRAVKEGKIQDIKAGEVLKKS